MNSHPSQNLCYQLRPIATAHAEREAAERFIAAAYLDKHGARLSEYLPEFVSMRSRSGELRAVAGYRAASTGPLYLEQYLPGTVEQNLSVVSGVAVPRSHIVEVGNLAGAGCRYVRYLVSQLPGYLLERGHTWVVFTATSLVRDILDSVGANLVELAIADGCRLNGGPAPWGQYYTRDPRVMAGYLPTSTLLSVHRRNRH
jgi:hypothetical protein